MEVFFLLDLLRECNAELLRDFWFMVRFIFFHFVVYIFVVSFRYACADITSSDKVADFKGAVFKENSSTSCQDRMNGERHYSMGIKPSSGSSVFMTLSETP